MNENVMQNVKELIADYQERLKRFIFAQTMLQNETMANLAELGLDEDVAIEIFAEATIKVATEVLPASKEDYQLATDLIKMALPKD